MSLRDSTILMAPRGATDKFFTDEDSERFLATGVIYCSGTEAPHMAFRRRLGIPLTAVPRPRVARRIEHAHRHEAVAAK